MYVCVEFISDLAVEEEGVWAAQEFDLRSRDVLEVGHMDKVWHWDIRLLLNLFPRFAGTVTFANFDDPAHLSLLQKGISWSRDVRRLASG